MTELNLALKRLLQLSYFNTGETKTQKRGDKLVYFPPICHSPVIVTLQDLSLWTENTLCSIDIILGHVACFVYWNDSLKWLCVACLMRHTMRRAIYSSSWAPEWSHGEQS